MIYQLAIISAVLSLTFADAYIGHAQPYAFGYSVKDHHGEQHRQETGDGGHAVKGSYGFTDDRGVHRQVDYVADHGGFRAQVKTNEPGTANQDPAAVKVISSAHPYLGAPGVHGGYGHGGGYGAGYAGHGAGYAGHGAGYAGHGAGYAGHGAGYAGYGAGLGYAGHGADLGYAGHGAGLGYAGHGAGLGYGAGYAGHGAGYAGGYGGGYGGHGGYGGGYGGYGYGH